MWLDRDGFVERHHLLLGGLADIDQNAGSEVRHSRCIQGRIKLREWHRGGRLAGPWHVADVIVDDDCVLCLIDLGPVVGAGRILTEQRRVIRQVGVGPVPARLGRWGIIAIMGGRTVFFLDRGPGSGCLRGWFI